MFERDKVRRLFLSGTQWQDWSTETLAGDASSRKYSRLTGPWGESAILMDANPTTGETVGPFIDIARWLTDHRLSAPQVLHCDQVAGFLLLEDLGHDTLAIATATTSEQVLYDAAVDVLVALDSMTPPSQLKSMTPKVGAEMVAITAETYHHCNPAPLVAATQAALEAFAPVADRVALRDFHAENLIWRPNRSGLDRIGLLDFQDAFVAPRGYDLASLLRDIRRTVSSTQVTRQIARFATATGIEPATLSAQLATLGAQRNLRILGVFARLIQRGKPQYASFLPTVWDALSTDLAHPALTDLRHVVLSTLPPPQDRR